MLPYVEIPDLPLVAANAFYHGVPTSDIAIRPFGAMVVVAVALGVWLSLRQARRLGVSLRTTIDFMYFVVVGGFLGGHVFDVVWYAPELLSSHPAILLSFPEGQSSFGGFLGAILGTLVYRWHRRVRVLGLAEIVSSSFPVAWFVGRLGCAIAHDHPGVRSDLWFAVAYPAGGRLDLGLLEAMVVLPLGLAFLLLRRRPRAPGFFVGGMCLSYAPVRFVLDALRATDLAGSDRRYLSLTPAQWGALGLFGVGLYFSILARKHRRPAGSAPIGAVRGSRPGPTTQHG